MFRGHFQGGSVARPQSTFARAIFTPNWQQCQRELEALHLYELEPQTFMDTLVLGENPDHVIALIRSDPDAASDIISWLRENAEAQISPDMVRTQSQTLTYFYERYKQAQKGATTFFDVKLPEKEEFVEPRPLLTPRVPHLGLDRLLNDFLSFSNNSQDNDDSLNSFSEIGSEESTPNPTFVSSATGQYMELEEDETTTAATENVFDFTWWMPKVMPLQGTCTAFYTLYYRVVGASMIAMRLKNVKRNQIKERVFRRKLERFVSAHSLIFQWIYQHGPHALVDVHDLEKLYRPLGQANMYACDRALIQVTRIPHVMRQTPLQLLEAQWPELYWRPEHVPRISLEKLTPANLRLLQPADDGTDGWSGWAPLSNITLETHRLYYGLIWVLNQCMRKLRKAEVLSPDLRYALWVYYVSWVDLFQHCLTVGRFDDTYLRLPRGSDANYFGTMNYEETACPWSLYGTCDTRTFCAGDLPNFFHVLVTLPLWGEQQTPPYFLGKLYQKSLPFAGARRHIIKLVIKSILDHPPFWRVFSRLMWVMLANLYPGELAGPYNTLGMRSLLRIKELCENRDMLIGTLLVHQPGMKEIWERREIQNTTDPFLKRLVASNKVQKGSGGLVAANGGPLIVATVFRMHIMYMGSLNATYVAQAQKLIDWDYHKAEAVRLSSLIRQRGVYAQDAFAQARTQLSKTIKSPNSHVHRIRRHSIAMMVQEKMNDLLEKSILKNRQLMMKEAEILASLTNQYDTVRVHRFLNETKLGAIAREAIDMGPNDVTPDILQLARAMTENCVRSYNQELDLGVKSAILNALLHVEPMHRLMRTTFITLLCQPQFGGISPMGAEIMWRLVVIASEKAAPKDFSSHLNAMVLHDFVVATYYFNAVVQLDKIHFVALDADTIERTENVLRTRCYQIDDHDDDDSMYKVAISLCCNRISNLMGQDKYGVRRVALDLERNQLVCVHNKPTRSTVTNGLPSIDNSEEGEEEEQEEEEEEEEQEEEGDGENEDDQKEDDARDRDHVVLSQTEAMAQDDRFDDEYAAMALLGLERADLIGDAMIMGGKGAHRARVVEDRKQIRNQRKLFSKIPCGQPVLVVSLRGRALLWGNTLEKRVQIMFCPGCGGLHMYTIFGMSMLESQKTGYRCADCMRAELTHLSYTVCAYCGKMVTQGPESVLMIMCPMNENTEDTLQPLYFCSTHYKIAQRHVKNVTKTDLWNIFKYVQEARAIWRARRLMNHGVGRVGYGKK